MNKQPALETATRVMLVSALLSDSSPLRGGSISTLMGLQLSAGTMVYDAFQQVWPAMRAAWTSDALKRYSATLSWAWTM